MNRKITYTVGSTNDGNFAGKITVNLPSKGAIRFQVGELTKAMPDPRVRSWDNQRGKGIAVDLWVDEDSARFGHDHWPSAEAALRQHFPGCELIYLSPEGRVVGTPASLGSDS